MKNISNIKKGENEYEISLVEGKLPFIESDMISVKGNFIKIKSIRIGEFYTKDSGSLDANCKTQEFEIKKENIINISLENGKKDLMRVFINLNNSDDIELVQLSNTIELAKFMDIMLNT